MRTAHSIGRRAEDLAAAFLERRGWTLLARNWRAGHREIDLIASRAGIIAFVEVKARRSRSYGHPLDAITRAKCRDLEEAARRWVAEHRARAQDFRFDAIWVVGDPDGVHEIEHLAGAWRL